jgi:phenylacetate-CoA ligase
MNDQSVPFSPPLAGESQNREEQSGNLASSVQMRAIISSGSSSYEALRRRQMKEFMGLLPEFVKRVRWPAETITAWRQHRLRRLLAHAKEKSPWHAKRLKSIDPERFTENDLARLPVMNKAELMENFDDIVTDRRVSLELVEHHLKQLESDAYLLGDLHAVASGGSSGTRGIFVFDWEGWLTFGLSSARPVMLMMEDSPVATRDSVLAFAAPNASHSSKAFIESFQPWIHSSFERFSVISAALPFDEIIARLNHMQPARISGFPSILYQLCFAAEDGRLKIKPTSILTGAEPLLPEIKQALKRIFGAKIYNFYGCSEASAIGFACPQAEGLHLADDLVIAEPVDASGEPTIDGKPSAKLLITNLFNTLLPLIRYEIDDSVTPIASTGRCACGSFFRKINDVQGRSDDCFLYDNGAFVHPLAFSALGHEPAVIEFQVQQTLRGAHILLRAARSFDQHHLAAEIVSGMRSAGIADPELIIEPVTELPRTSAGKLKRFVRLPH